MITTLGKLQIQRFLIGSAASFAQSIAYGISKTSESLTDTTLQFELGSSPITYKTFDATNNKIIFKATLPAQVAAEINEVGIYSLSENPLSTDTTSKVISYITSENDIWVDSASNLAETYVTNSNIRVGADAIQHAPAASSSKSSSKKNINLSFDGYSALDNFVLAFYAGNTNISSISLKFMTDSSNYYSFNVSASNGYNIKSLLKGSATVTGTPSWSNISEIKITTTANSSGAASVIYDSLMISDTDRAASDYILVARTKLASPVIKTAGAGMDIEYVLDWNIS